MEIRRRILILDDETRVAFFLRESLEALGHDFEVISVSSTEEALQQFKRQTFDLLITDQYMPGMKGLELIELVQQLSPDTRFILITAYGSEDVLAQARRLGTYHFFTKPFRIEEFVQTVLHALNSADSIPSDHIAHGPHAPAGSGSRRQGRQEDGLPELLPAKPDLLGTRLEELRREVGAQSLLAATAAGSVLAQAGSCPGLDLEQLLQLAAAGFNTSLAMAQHLGGTHRGNLAFYEGTQYDIYMANVEDDLFLLIIFDRAVQTSRVGIVWLYARRAVESLRRVRAVSLLR